MDFHAHEQTCDVAHSVTKVTIVMKQMHAFKLTPFVVEPPEYQVQIAHLIRGGSGQFILGSAVLVLGVYSKWGKWKS